MRFKKFFAIAASLFLGVFWAFGNLAPLDAFMQPEIPAQKKPAQEENDKKP